MEYKRKKGTYFRHLLNAPILSFQLITAVFLDASIELYHRTGFPLCGIPLVKRSSYIKLDRHKLKYLNWRNKIGCTYCGYASGLLAYTSEIIARTETYWCGIKHQKTSDLIEPPYHKKFVEYGDEAAYRKKYL